MGIIQSNLFGLSAGNNLGITQSNLARSIAALTSGLRINHAADDAAGLAISQALAAQLSGTQQAAQNVQDATSMLQTADGALSGSQDILQRMNQLAVQAGNGTLNGQQRGAIQTELNHLADTLNQIGSNTQFNGQSLLSGNLGVTITTGQIASSDPNVTVQSIDLTNARTGTTYSLSVCTSNGTATYSTGGASQTVHVSSLAANGSTVLNFDALGVKIGVQAGSTAVSSTQVLTALQTGGSSFTTAHSQGSTTFQVGPNAGPSNQVGANFNAVNTNSLGLSSGVLNVSTVTNANNLQIALSHAMHVVGTQRSTLGALQNGLAASASSLNIAAENLTSAQSRIQDANVASAMINFTTNQIMQQGTTAIIAQANLSPALGATPAGMSNLDASEIERILEQTTVVRSPLQPLATFGVTTVIYHLVTEPVLADGDAAGAEAVVRTGTMKANRPQIITPAYLLNLFRGFEHGSEFADYLRSSHGPNAPGLLYSYENEPGETNVVSDSPEVVAHRIADQLDRDGVIHAAVIRGVSMYWDVSLMKFIHDVTVAALGQTIGDFGKQGLLTMDGGVPRQARARIDEMFAAVRSGSLPPQELKNELDRWNLFEEYQDRFFALFRRG